MVIRLFKESHPATYIIVPAFILLFLTISWQGAGEYVIQNPMPLYDLMLNLVLKLPEWVTGLIVYLILISQVFHLNYVIGKHEVFYRNSYLPALFYMIFLAMIPLFMTFHPVLIINSILIFVLDKLFKIYKNAAPLTMAFDVCFLIGVATLIYLPAISFFILFAFSILILKTFAWRDWMVGITGLILPFFFAFVYYFWIDGIEEMKSTFFLDDISKILDTGGLVLQGYRITLVVVAVVVGLTLIRIRQNFYKNVARIRNFMQVMIMFSIVALLSLAFTGSVAVYRFSILIIPISTLISYYFLAGKKAWINEVVFWILIATLVLNHLNIMK